MIQEIKQNYAKGLITYGEMLVALGEVYNAECKQWTENHEHPFQGSLQETELLQAIGL